MALNDGGSSHTAPVSSCPSDGVNNDGRRFRTRPSSLYRKDYARAIPSIPDGKDPSNHRRAGERGPAKLRGTEEKFVSRLPGTGVTRTNALETLVIAGFVRGPSVRDVETALADALGPQATLSKSTVSQVCQAIGEELNTWRPWDDFL